MESRTAPNSGASMSPVRPLAPDLVRGDHSAAWIFGPIINWARQEVLRHLSRAEHRPEPATNTRAHIRGIGEATPILG